MNQTHRADAPASDPMSQTHRADALSSAPVLEARDVVVRYSGHPPVLAVNGVSVTISAGETVALVGESGSGKSSFARVCAGIEGATEGTVRFDGMDVKPLGLRRRPRELTGIQTVFQDPSTSLNPRRRIGDQISDGIRAARARGLAGSKPQEWLERVGLDPDMARRMPHEFSGGQKQRIAIARALASRPHLLVADEPISALDASTQTSVARLMQGLITDVGAGMLFISHDLAVVRRIADRILVMYRGRVVEEGPTEQVWNDPRQSYTQALLAAIPEPDGTGTIPRSPTAEERASWSELVPVGH